VNGAALSATLDRPNQGGLGKIQSGALELSNVDLTEEFANMITAQRSFQASSRLVTVSDTVLEDIVNLKR
jgi:flagellar hook protein FlgE